MKGVFKLDEKTFGYAIGKRMILKLNELFEKEKSDPEFLNQNDFPDCKSRAMAWLEMAFEESKNDMANDAGLVIAVHREIDHSDNTLEEQTALLEAGADPEISATAWWNGG